MPKKRLSAEVLDGAIAWLLARPGASVERAAQQAGISDSALYAELRRRGIRGQREGRLLVFRQSVLKVDPSIERAWRACAAFIQTACPEVRVDAHGKFVVLEVATDVAGAVLNRVLAAGFPELESAGAGVVFEARDEGDAATFVARLEAMLGDTSKR